MGLPRRHPRGARGGGVRRLRGARVGRRTARPSAATGPTARAWSSSGRSRTRCRRPSPWSATPVVPEGFLHVFDGLDDRDHVVSLVHEDSPELRRMAVFDAVVNNADRKGGHVLAMTDGHRYGVDHGLTFHIEHKLRTVLWGWAGELLTDEDRVWSGAARRRARRRPGGAARRPAHLARGGGDPATRQAAAADRDPAGARPGLARHPLAALLMDVRDPGPAGGGCRASVAGTRPGCPVGGPDGRRQGCRSLHACAHGPLRICLPCPRRGRRCGCTTRPRAVSSRPHPRVRPGSTSAGSRRTTPPTWAMLRRTSPSTC